MSNFHIRFEIYTLCEDSVFIDTPCSVVMVVMMNMDGSYGNVTGFLR